MRVHICFSYHTIIGDCSKYILAKKFLHEKCNMTVATPTFYCDATKTSMYINTWTFIYRSRRAEAHIQQMLWKVSYSDIVFFNMVCIS